MNTNEIISNNMGTSLCLTVKLIFFLYLFLALYFFVIWKSALATVIGITVATPCGWVEISFLAFEVIILCFSIYT